MAEGDRRNWNLEALANHDGNASLWKLFDFIATEERHFNDIQAKYRLLASGWLLASFAGIGFVVTERLNVQASPYLLAAGIAAAGALGIQLLWVVDLLVYQRLLDSCFVEGLKLERTLAEMPPFRHNMMKMQSGEGVLFRVVGFYLGPTVLLTLITGLALVLYVRTESPAYAPIVAVATVLLALVWSYLMYVKTANTAVFGTMLEADSRFDDDAKSRKASRVNRLKSLRSQAVGFAKGATVLVVATLISGVILVWFSVSPGAVGGLATVRLPGAANDLAPDGSEVRLLVRGDRGSMAHFTLPAGEVSQAVAHGTVEELWYFVAGRGEMWRRRGSEEQIVEVSAGVSITIPTGTSFQFRALGDEPLEAVGVTMPAWPGSDEAYPVPGTW